MAKKIFDWNFLQKKADWPNCAFLSGTDEVGRGPLAGPVVSCTVMMGKKGRDDWSSLLTHLKRLQELGVTDSKKVSSQQRQEILRSLGISVPLLKVKKTYRGVGIMTSEPGQGLLFSLAAVSAGEIDRLNILQASLCSMRLSLLQCWNSYPSAGRVERTQVFAMVDGQHSIPDLPQSFQQFPIVQGDGKSLLIGLSSMIAKEYRDHYMMVMDAAYPGYEWKTNAGYPTKIHKERLATLGPSPLHRKTFRGVKEYFHDFVQ